ncbi:hypothetical protein Sjap_005167 [Stephania japonica]|uniref:Uncharacterized protein n=1 Tax=Stephania japonica TaxID=461633 RepID=A0AAP0K4W6_9MAGN
MDINCDVCTRIWNNRPAYVLDVPNSYAIDPDSWVFDTEHREGEDCDNYGDTKKDCCAASATFDTSVMLERILRNMYHPIFFISSTSVLRRPSEG